MSSYFASYYSRVHYPIEFKDQEKGLRNAQQGAIHSIARHFTLHDSGIPALVVMPTGSGKSSVIAMTPYILRAKRVLVISSSKLVRGQLYEEFNMLSNLKRILVLANDIPAPKTLEVTKTYSEEAHLSEFENYDVVIGIPSTLQTYFDQARGFDKNLFDLVLVDEAHHTPAKTWHYVAECFNARKVYFTATPFRRDRQEIKGTIAFDYPLHKAFEDEIFGKLGYYAVKEDGTTDTDVLIAKKAESVFIKDREDGLQHCLMIRTDSQDDADRLKKLYTDHTTLKVETVHSRYSYTTIKKTIEKLREGSLDGIVCVDMMGEGFDFPRLKIAALHKAHQSLAITLQFIGRFARTNADNLGIAKFIATEGELKTELDKLYIEGSIWNEIIVNLSESAVDAVSRKKDFFSETEPIIRGNETRNLSLYGIEPYFHSKIYAVNDFNINATPGITGLSLIFQEKIAKQNVITFIYKSVEKPKWLERDDLINQHYDLLILYYDPTIKLLFICSTIKNNSFYEYIAELFSNKSHRRISKQAIHRSLAGTSEHKIYNFGIRSLSPDGGEAYRSHAGNSTQNVVGPEDASKYSNGHIFGSHLDNGEQKTLGYSSGAKLWSNKTGSINEFVDWCKYYGKKIVSNVDFKTHTSLDYLRREVTIDSIAPELKITYVDWNEDIYMESPKLLVVDPDGGECQTYNLLDFEISAINLNGKTFEIQAVSGDFSFPLSFDFENFYQNISDYQLTVKTEGGEEVDLTYYLSELPCRFYFNNFSVLFGNVDYLPFDSDFKLSFPETLIQTIDWNSLNIDIHSEIHSKTAKHISIHEGIKNILVNKTPTYLIYDHGSGEMADFVFVKEDVRSIGIELYHIKATHASANDMRVDDFYEVCGQASKSSGNIASPYIFLKALERRTKNRNDKFIVGTYDNLVNLIATTNRQLKFKINVVQPGAKKSIMDDTISRILASAKGMVEKNVNCTFGLICSE